MEVVPVTRKRSKRDEVEKNIELKRSLESLDQSTRIKDSDLVGRGSCFICSKSLGRRKAIVGSCHALCCNQQTYCSNECLEADKIRLDKNCINSIFEIRTESGFLRMYAKQPISNTSRIFIKPMVIFPKMVYHESRDGTKPPLAYFTCVGCHQLMLDGSNLKGVKVTTNDVTKSVVLNINQPNYNAVEALGHYKLCKRCRWPICSLYCQLGPMHQKECNFLAKLKKADKRIPLQEDLETSYYLLGVLRVVLFLKNKDVQKYNEFMQLPVSAGKESDVLKASKLVADKWEDYWSLLKLRKTEVTSILSRLFIYSLDHQWVFPWSERFDYGVYPVPFKVLCKPNSRLEFNKFDLTHVSMENIQQGDEIRIEVQQRSLQMPSFCNPLVRCSTLKLNHLTSISCSCNICNQVQTSSYKYLYDRKCEESKCKQISTVGKVKNLQLKEFIWQWKCKDGHEATREMTKREKTSVIELKMHLKKSPLDSIAALTSLITNKGGSFAKLQRSIVNRMCWFRVIRIADYLNSFSETGSENMSLLDKKTYKRLIGYVIFFQKIRGRHTVAEDSCKRYLFYIGALLKMARRDAGLKLNLLKSQKRCLEHSLVRLWRGFNDEREKHEKGLHAIIKKKKKLIDQIAIDVD